MSDIIQSNNLNYIKNKSHQRSNLMAILIFVTLFFFFSFTNTTLAANRFWVGANGATVHSTASWSATSGGASGASIPTTADVAIFDINNTNNALIDATWSVGSISMTADYTGTTTTNTDINVNITGNFTKLNGTWDSAGSITFTGTTNSTLTCSGVLPGTVVITKETSASVRSFTLSENCSINLGANPTSILQGYPHTFTNNGTITIDSGTWTINNANSSVTYNINFINNGTINHNSTSWVINNRNGTVTNNGTINYTDGTGLTINGSFNQAGTLNASANLITTFNNEVNTTMTCASTYPGTVVITKITAASAKSFTLSENCSISLGADPISTLQGYPHTFTNHGTITIESGIWTINNARINTAGYNINFINNGTINHNGTGWVINNGSGTVTNNGTINYTDGTGLTINGHFTQNSTFNVSADLVTTFNHDTSTTMTCASTYPGTVSITKTSYHTARTFTLSENCSISLGAEPVGTLNGNSHTFTNHGTITIESGIWTINNASASYNINFINNGTINHNGTGWVINNRNGTVTNNGTINYTDGTGLTISGSFNQAGTLNASSTPGILAIIFDSAINSTLTGSLGTNISIILNKSVTNTLTLANDISVYNATTTAGILANPASSQNLTVTGNLSIADASKFGGTNLSLVMSGINDQTLSVTGTLLTDLEINKLINKVTLNTNLTTNTERTCTVTFGTLFLNGKTINCAGNLTITANGILQLIGDETVSTTTTILASDSTVTYIGNGDSLSNTYNVNVDLLFYNLNIESEDDNDIYTFPITLSISGNLIQNNGIINATSTNLILTGIDQTITLATTTTINSLTKISSTTDATLLFNNTESSPLIITATTTLQATGDGTLTLASTNPGTAWYFSPDGPRVLGYFTVSDSTNLGTEIDTTGLNIIDGGNNINWTFGTIPDGTIFIGTSGLQNEHITLPAINQELGGSFPITVRRGDTTLEAITFHYTGTIATSSLSDITLYTHTIASTTVSCPNDIPTNTPVYGSSQTIATSSLTFTDSFSISANSRICLYLTYTLDIPYDFRLLGRDIDFEINDPLTDVLFSVGTITNTSLQKYLNITGRSVIINPDISFVSFKVRDPLKNPTLYYVRDYVLYKKEGDAPERKMNNPNLKIHSLDFTGTRPSRGPALINYEMIIANVEANAPDHYLKVIRRKFSMSPMMNYLKNQWGR